MHSGTVGVYLRKTASNSARTIKRSLGSARMRCAWRRCSGVESKDGEKLMKKIIAAAVLVTAAALSAAPAFAQAFNKGDGTANTARNVTPENPDGIFRYPVTDGSAQKATSANAQSGPAKKHRK
jgi:hypothetical protein